MAHMEHTHTHTQVVVMLKKFKSSANQREQEVFACMIHNLFDEYRFFPRYPDKVRVCVCACVCCWGQTGHDEGGRGRITRCAVWWCGCL